MSADLPAGWIWARFSDVASIAANLVDPAKWPRLPHIAPDNIERDTGTLLPYRTVQEDGVTSAKHRFYPGQLLYSKIRPYLNKCIRAEFDGLCSADMYPVDAFISAGFLHHFMLTRQFVSAVSKAAGSRTILPKTNQAQMAALPVPVAPLPEQLRIVEAVDSYVTRVDAADGSLKGAQRKLKAYRTSVLKAAVEGRLVPTEAELARKEGRSYEPAEVLLERILKERRRCWELTERARMKAAGKARKDDKWKANYEEPESLDFGVLPRLPDGWCWAPAAAMYWDAGYGTSVKCVEDGSGPAVLRIPNIVEGRVDLDDLKFAVDDATLRSHDRIQPGDFLFIRTNGSRSLIGKGALVLRDHAAPLFFASYLIRLRLVTVDSCDQWFALAWSGPQVREQVLRVAASSAGQHNVSLSAASSFAIPLPPAAEQARIVAEFGRLDTETAAVGHEIAAGAKRCSRLRQAVLKWAFEGRLADQDPTDEPAATLLARLRAERAEAAPVKPKQKPLRQPKMAS
jgi:type I restriction enzyme, S subunit